MDQDILKQIITVLTDPTFPAQFIKYTFRWQLSSLILAPVIWLGARRHWNAMVCAVLANLIGACIFYWIDKFFIF